MTPELYWVLDILPKRLAVIPRPMGGEWLRDEVAGWKQRGIDIMVCLLERHEVRELELERSPCTAAQALGAQGS